MTEARTGSPSPARVQLPALGYSLLLAVLTAFGLHALFFSGPAMRIAAQEQLERTIAAEDRHFCEMFGMRSGTDAFVACSRELANVRQRQADRDTAAVDGIL
jgi:hypothetical protein